MAVAMYLAVSKSQFPNIFLITGQNYPKYLEHKNTINMNSATFIPYQRLELKSMSTEKLHKVEIC